MSRSTRRHRKCESLSRFKGRLSRWLSRITGAVFLLAPDPQNHWANVSILNQETDLKTCGYGWPISAGVVRSSAHRETGQKSRLQLPSKSRRHHGGMQNHGVVGIYDARRMAGAITIGLF